MATLEEYIMKQPSNYLKDLAPHQKNLDVKVIILNKNNPKELKNQSVITECIVADSTA